MVKVSTCLCRQISSDTSRYSSRGFNAYFTVYQDAQAWLKGRHTRPDLSHDVFSGKQFLSICARLAGEQTGRQVIPGLGIYFLYPSEGNWKRDEVERLKLISSERTSWRDKDITELNI